MGKRTLERNKNKKAGDIISGFWPGAQRGNRTPTPLRIQDFESSASTNSAIWALQRLTVAGCKCIKKSQITNKIYKYWHFGNLRYLCTTKVHTHERK